MQSLVDSLAQQRKRHLETIENVTMRDLKDMVKKKYCRIPLIYIF